MQAKLPLQISSIILLLFALGHTAGFLSFRPRSPEAPKNLGHSANVSNAV
jgi:hypothetical protein